MSARTIEAVPLTAEAFRPYGDVIEAGERYSLINRGTTRQYSDLAEIDVDAQGGEPRISIYRVTPCTVPLVITMLERHPLSSQLFIPFAAAPFLVVVAAGGADTIDPGDVRAFRSNGRQGVNYRRGTWHHPVLALDHETEFLVLDRHGSDRNCDEFHLGEADRIVVRLPAR